MPFLCLRLVAAALLAMTAFAGPVAAVVPKVVVSIKPIHSLVAGVMEGVADPDLIVGAATSPHVYTLKPSDAKRLARADLIFWIGPIFEGFLVRPLAALPGKAEIVELDRAPGVTLLSAREGGAWEQDEDHHAASALEQDGHLWLDPENAKAIVRVSAMRLAALDGAHAARYAANAAALERRLDALDAALRQRLAAVQGRRFVVFHDAYQYLERRYDLAAIGSITVNPETQPGARRLEAIRGKIKTLGARCVFREPQFEPRLVDVVLDGTSARTGVLDPEGALLAHGPELYFELMNGLADALTHCLG